MTWHVYSLRTGHLVASLPNFADAMSVAHVMLDRGYAVRVEPAVTSLTLVPAP